VVKVLLGLSFMVPFRAKNTKQYIFNLVSQALIVCDMPRFCHNLNNKNFVFNNLYY